MCTTTIGGGYKTVGNMFQYAKQARENPGLPPPPGVTVYRQLQPGESLGGGAAATKDAMSMALAARSASKIGSQFPNASPLASSFIQQPNGQKTYSSNPQSGYKVVG